MSALIEEFATWLAEFLPKDYYRQYPKYRWDLALRRDYQRAAFEAGWIQPTWPREHGGRETRISGEDLILGQVDQRSSLSSSS